MHTADLLPMLFIGGVMSVLVGRLVVTYFKAKLA